MYLLPKEKKKTEEAFVMCVCLNRSCWAEFQESTGQNRLRFPEAQNNSENLSYCGTIQLLVSTSHMHICYITFNIHGHVFFMLVHMYQLKQ